MLRRSLWLALALTGCPYAPPDGGQVGADIPSLQLLQRLGPTLSCTLHRWEDGDTPYVRCAGGPPEPVRLIGIDTAESGFDDNSRRRAQWQSKIWKLTYDDVVACGKAATERAKELCPEGRAVEVTGHERDKYERRLGYVVCDGVEMNGRLVAEGLAGRYPYPRPPQRPSGCPVSRK